MTFKDLIKNIICIKKEDGNIVIKIIGIKIAFCNPLINRLEDVCCIPDLERLRKNKTRFPHPIGITINKGAVIGKNCTIYQNVTIGAGKNHKETPIIGDNVIIFANAVIIGKITIGDNAIIGAGSVVLNNVEANTVVAGNPVKLIK